jgi:hypothetical protein
VKHHYTFAEDATETFLRSLHAFMEHRDSNDLSPRSFPALVACIKDLHTALEKAFKHQLTCIDPHLALSNLNQTFYLDMVKARVRQKKPSIYCLDTRIETVGLVTAWKTLMDCSEDSLDQSLRASFEEALVRLANVRNAAQHGEIYMEPAALLAVAERVLGLLPDIVYPWLEDFRELVERRSGNLGSILQAIREKIDYDWQVLNDRLYGTNMVVPIHGWLSAERPGEVHLIMGEEGDGRPLLMTHGNAYATGLFGSVLTESEWRSRELRRQTVLTEKGLDVDALRARHEKKSHSAADALPLYATAELSLPETGGLLEFVHNGLVSAQVNLVGTTIRFADENQPLGVIEGTLEPALRRTSPFEPIDFKGKLWITHEMAISGDENDALSTQWQWYGTVDLTLRYADL